MARLAPLGGVSERPVRAVGMLRYRRIMQPWRPRDSAGYLAGSRSSLGLRPLCKTRDEKSKKKHGNQAQNHLDSRSTRSSLPEGH